MSDDETETTYPNPPDEIHMSEAKYVRLDMKLTTARRLSGWLESFASYCELAGNTTTAEHANHVAQALKEKVEQKDYKADGE